MPTASPPRTRMLRLLRSTRVITKSHRSSSWLCCLINSQTSMSRRSSYSMPLRRCRWKSLTDRNGPNFSVVPGTRQPYKCPPSTAIILISSFERSNGGGRECISSIIPLNYLRSLFFDSSLRLFTHPISIISRFILSMTI